jgi:hypothetical protein
MEINRNQYFMAGIIVLLLGLQLRMVDSYVLKPEATRMLAQGSSDESADGVAVQAAEAAGARKTVHPPDWSGWCLMSIGAVLILHSLAMRRPG